MTQPAIHIQFDTNGRNYEAGDVLTGTYRLESIPLTEVRTVEVSVLWHTEGKGDEDLAVHEFQRLGAENGEVLDLGRGGRFQTTLPHCPLSYDGAIIKLGWFVRIRVFLTQGKEVVGQRQFRLGSIPPIATE